MGHFCYSECRKERRANIRRVKTTRAGSRKTWACPEPKIKSGYLTRYAKLVSSADKGAILQ